MPFEILETVPRDSSMPMASISYEKPKNKNSDRIPRLIVAIPTVLSGTCKLDRFRIEIGTGADAGKARISGIVKGTPGPSAPGTMLKHTLVIRFGKVPALGEDAAAKEMCPVEKVDANTWQLTLPPWCKPEPKKK